MAQKLNIGNRKHHKNLIRVREIVNGLLLWSRVHQFSRVKLQETCVPLALKW
jgi:hypothetical protein